MGMSTAVLLSFCGIFGMYFSSATGIFGVSGSTAIVWAGAAFLLGHLPTDRRLVRGSVKYVLLPAISLIAFLCVASAMPRVLKDECSYARTVPCWYVKYLGIQMLVKAFVALACAVHMAVRVYKETKTQRLLNSWWKCTGLLVGSFAIGFGVSASICFIALIH